MADEVQEARRRHWADVVVIVASVYSLVAGYRVPPEVMTLEGPEPVGSVRWLMAAYALGGLLGLGGLIAAFKWLRPAQGMVALGGLVVLSGLLALDHYTAVNVLSLGLTGLVLLVAAPFTGAMPSPEEEGRPRG